MADLENGRLDWDSEIENDGQEFITLPEGDYNFIVSNFERGSFPGSDKIPACYKATLTLNVESDSGPATCKTDLILCKSLEWKLSSFFRCIGQKKHGERLRMDWSKVPNAQGRAHFKPRKYTTKNGTERETNDVAYFIDYDPKFFTETSDELLTMVPGDDDEDMPF